MNESDNHLDQFCLIKNIDASYCPIIAQVMDLIHILMSIYYVPKTALDTKNMAASYHGPCSPQ